MAVSSSPDSHSVVVFSGQDAEVRKLNLRVNRGLFAAGVWVARNLTDIDLMAPQPST
ncbi:PREDICTED: mitochondrial import receptor subunit TOM6 homolog [Tinamus guttatus]|uniref:mitochondrial import receptor subunit TOM6 homolog n=1 Tax=Tinamus guttatus TaxID=94827 RepID=UPI00052EDFD1|nr:PREDICTED: mitochondrial import receptor subunit TOM6 homolog [Tinamus guttatus]